MEPNTDYSPESQSAYVTALKSVCLSLEFLPARFTEVEINGRILRRVRFKAHTIFYQISDADKSVAILAILPSVSDFESWL